MGRATTHRRPGTLRHARAFKLAHIRATVADAESQPLPRSAHAGNLLWRGIICGSRATLRQRVW